MNHFQFSDEQASVVEDAIGYRFCNRALLTQAFTRSSFRNEHPECPDNEVLELIGDSVLSLTVLTDASETFVVSSGRAFSQEWNEGKLSSLKNALVNKHHLAECMRTLHFSDFLLMSHGDKMSGIAEEDSVLEDLTESLIGAVYTDSDWNFPIAAEVARKILHLGEALKRHADGKIHISYRNDLQEWVQAPVRALGVPQYTTEPQGEIFRCTVRIAKLGIECVGIGKNGKLSQEAAAKAMWEMIRRMEEEGKISLCEEKPTAPSGEENPISILQTLVQKAEGIVPQYREICEVNLPDNSHLFTVACECLGRRAEGTGNTKKEAKKKSAEAMLRLLGKL